MDIKNAVIGGLVGLAVVLGGLYFLHSPQVPAPIQQAFGSASPDIPSPYISFGSVRQWAAGMPLTQNASTTCDMVSPASTSTLESAGINFATASSSALIVEIGKSAGGFATTTLIGTLYNVAANTPVLIQASTSPAAGAVTVFGPNTHLSIKIGAGAPGTVVTGRCNAIWVEYPTL